MHLTCLPGEQIEKFYAEKCEYELKLWNNESISIVAKEFPVNKQVVK